VWAGHLGAQGILLKPLQILVAVCALLLVIVCANVSNLLLARAVSSTWQAPSVKRPDQDQFHRRAECGLALSYLTTPHSAIYN
jgi:hypothetical protein